MHITKLIVNLRGHQFHVKLKHMLKLPQSLLGRIARIVRRHESDGEITEIELEFITEVKELTQCIDDVRVSTDNGVLEVEMNRTPVLFHYILDVYVEKPGEEGDGDGDGEGVSSMHLPAAFCAKLVHEEMKFWGVAERKLVTCCWAKLREEQEKQITLQRVQDEWGMSGTPDHINYEQPTHFLEGPIVTRKAKVSVDSVS